MNDEDRILWDRAFDKFDDLNEKVTELCITTAATRTKLNDHLDEQEKKGVRKERVFYVVIAAIASIFSFVTFIRTEI